MKNVVWLALLGVAATTGCLVGFGPGGPDRGGADFSTGTMTLTRVPSGMCAPLSSTTAPFAIVPS